MRTIPAALKSHLDQEATTTCHGWRVTRRDGVTIGFTDHDRDLIFDGTTFLAASGFAASEGEQAAGLAATADEVSGGLSSDVLDEADLVAGRYDGARVELFLVNWAAPDQHMRLNLREIGEVVRAGGAFRAELRSMAHRLDQPQGRLYGRRCDASLGDARCRVDLVVWRGDGVVVEMIDRSRLLVSGLAAFAQGFFRQGRIAFSQGLSADIEEHEKRADGLAVLSLWLPLDDDAEVAQVFTVTAGCDKRFETCRQRFANGSNFRGFPHVPGADFAYSYADGERVHDGGPIFE
jgi:uncharacterized phage protein (TIGR02218 family)